MTIYNSDGTTLAEITPDDSSFHIETLMSDDHIMLYFSSDTHINIPVGSYILEGGKRYTLLMPESVKLQHRTLFEYTVQFMAWQGFLKLWKFRNYTDMRTKFSLTTDARGHIDSLVSDLNRRTNASVTIGSSTFDYGTGISWSGSSDIDTAYKLISYDNLTCWEALQLIADTFETEFKINGTSITLGKVEVNKDTPYELSYGKGNGFKSGVTRSNANNMPPIDMLLVQGGSQNIDKSTYHHNTLQLPYDPQRNTIKQIGFDGTYFEDETGYDAQKACIYITLDGNTIMNVNAPLSERRIEASVDCSDIYPKRVGTVTSVPAPQNGIYSIVDSNIPNELDYSQYILAGETMSIIFQSGQLAGREFQVEYHHNDGYGTRLFKLVPIEEEGLTIPAAGGYEPAVGNTYAVFHCSLPASYIRNDTNKSGASWDMMRQAIRSMYELQLEQYTFTGEIDPIYAYNHRLPQPIPPRPSYRQLNLSLGCYISFTDTSFQQQAMLMRVTSLKTNINNIYKKELTMSTAIVRRSKTKLTLTTTSGKIEDNMRLFEKANNGNKRTFREISSDLTNINGNITDLRSSGLQNPSITRLITSDEAAQFVVITSFANHAITTDTITVSNNGDTISVGKTYVQHKTLGLDSIVSSRSDSDFKCYSIPQYTNSSLNDVEYYLYAIITDSTAGRDSGLNYFQLSTTLMDFKYLSVQHAFLFAKIGTKYNNTRSITRLYGYTKLNGSQMTVNKIKAVDSDVFFDLTASRLKLNNNFEFSSSALKLFNAQHSGSIFNYREVNEETRILENDRVIVSDGANLYLPKEPTVGVVYSICNTKSDEIRIISDNHEIPIIYNGSSSASISLISYSKITLMYILHRGWICI